MNNRYSLLSPWENWRKAILFSTFALYALLVVVATLPIGWVFFLAILLTSLIWKSPSDPVPMDKNKSPYMPQTRAYGIANFFECARIRKDDILKPAILLGFGPPARDEDHGIESISWLPPLRMSSWWVLFAALVLSLIDMFVNQFLFPVWGFTPPGLIMYVLSAVGWFAGLQFITDISRRRAGADGAIEGPEPAPAVMLNKVNLKSSVLQPGIIAIVSGLSALFISAIILIMFDFSVWYSLIIFLVLTTMIFVMKLSSDITIEYRKFWQERNNERDQFSSAWAYKADKSPTYMDTTLWPSEDEWNMKYPDEPYQHKLKIIRAVFADSCLMNDYFGDEDKVIGSLEATQMVFVPIEERDSANREIKGSVGPLGFSLWFTQDNNRYTIDSIFSDDTEKLEKDFAIRENILKPLRQIKGIGECTLVGFSVLTKPKKLLKDPANNRSLLDVKIKPIDPSVSINNFRDGKVIEALKSWLKVDYVRAYKDPKSVDNSITLLIGDIPYDNVEFRRPFALIMKMIRDADFSHVFHVNKIFSSQGTPSLKDFAEINAVEEQEFNLPQGLSFDQVAKAKEIIMENTGNSFMEIKKGSSQALKSKKKVKWGNNKTPENDKDSLATTFTITSAKVNPLNRLFFFMDYKDQILLGRKKGEENLTWYPGVKSNDTLAKDDFDSDMPHLLIAGSSGSGKHLYNKTPIYTFNRGWITVGDIVEGDILFDMLGFQTNVVNAFEPVELRTYHDISFSTDETICASPTHLWSVVPQNAPKVEAVAPVVHLNVGTVLHGETDGSAWFIDQEKAVEATSWVDLGQMEETNPHVSSRIAQSAIRGIDPFIWGYLFSLIDSKERSISGISVKNPVKAIKRAFDNCGHPLVYDGDKDAWFAKNLNELIAIAWEETNTSLGLVHDVVDVLGYDVDLLHGMSYGAKTLCTKELLNIFSAKEKPVLKEMGVLEFDKVLSRLKDKVKSAEQYLLGLQESTLSQGGYSVVWDNSVRYHLLSYGVVTPLIGSVGVGLLPVVAKKGFNPDYVQDYVSGYMSQIGAKVDDVYARAPIVHGHIVQAAKHTDQIEIIGSNVDVALTFIGNRSSDHFDSPVVHQLYDRCGQPVFTVDQIAAKTKLSIPEVVKLVAGLIPVGGCRTPVLQKFTTSTKAKVSGEWALYTIGDVNKTSGTYVEAQPMFTCTSKQLPENSVIPRGVVDGDFVPEADPRLAAFAIANKLDKDNLLHLGFVEPKFAKNDIFKWKDKDGNFVGRIVDNLNLSLSLPVGIMDASAAYRQAFVDAYDEATKDVHVEVEKVRATLGGDVVVEKNVVVKSDVAKKFRCISVDSPTRTYRAGESSVPTHNSVVVQNMICQMIYNNDPSDLRMWFVEPKIGLQRFRYYDTTERFTDSWSPTENFFENVLEWAHDLVEEMLRRNRLMAYHIDPVTGRMPEKLQQAREIAKEEGVETPDGGVHELWIPYIVAFVEECATVFAESADKEQKAIQTAILVDLARLARESRASGMFMVCLTQYPTNASIPSVIRNQMRRLGLATQNSLASRVCIEEDGLEKLTIKGAGMIKGKGGVFEQFRGFLLRDGNPTKGEANDIVDCLTGIPNSFLDGDVSVTDSSDPFISVDKVNSTVFNLWESVNGPTLEEAIDGQYVTRDFTDDDLDKILAKN